MEWRDALTGQLRSALRMLRNCVERCPADLWREENPPQSVVPAKGNPDWNGVERQFWRIAFHAVYFTHLYVAQGSADFEPPDPSLEVFSRPDFAAMWVEPWSLEPYELPTGTDPLAQADLLSYLEFVDDLIAPTLEQVDLTSASSGFPWYASMSKAEHVLLNLRHLQGHVGQLSELLMLRGIDIDWVS